jgi:hypothetical protein
MKKISMITFLTLLCSMNISHALGLKFGAKIGQELFNSHAKGAPDGDAPSTFLAMGELDLSIVSLELNLGSHSSLVQPSSAKLKLVNQEFTIAAIVRLSLPLIPKLLSLDIGGGLDQRVLMSQSNFATEAEIKDISGKRTMLPISAQITVNVSVVKFYLESRFNLELSNSFESSRQSKELDANHEYWILGGIAF